MRPVFVIILGSAIVGAIVVIALNLRGRMLKRRLNDVLAQEGIVRTASELLPKSDFQDTYIYSDALGGVEIGILANTKKVEAQRRLTLGRLRFQNKGLSISEDTAELTVGEISWRVDIASVNGAGKFAFLAVTPVQNGYLFLCSDEINSAGWPTVLPDILRFLHRK